MEKDSARREEKASLLGSYEALGASESLSECTKDSQGKAPCRGRKYRVAAKAIICVMLFTILVQPALFYYSLIPGCAMTKTRWQFLSFSDTHREWIPAPAVDYLLSIRDSLSSSGKWVGVKPEDVDVAKLRNDAGGPIIEGVSDDAVRALVGREGYKVGYIDITDTIDPMDRFLAQNQLPSLELDDSTGQAEVPYAKVNITAHPEYKKLVEMVSVQELKYIVGNLSVGFTTRYYRSRSARAPSEWIHGYLEPLPNSTVSYYENTFNQPNVITRLAPASANSSTPTILLGGHLDSTSPFPIVAAPGADDDASGTAIVMHVISILAKSGWVQAHSKYPIEAHAYGGEEGGLLGATALASSYRKAARKIHGVLNVEMVGWQPESGNNSTSTITVLSDPNAAMSAYMEEVVKAYVPTADVRGAYCGYGCSDHYAWSSRGYPVVCLASYGPNDRNLNPHYHSTSDRLEYLDFDRMADFARAALAWVVQVAS